MVDHWKHVPIVMSLHIVASGAKADTLPNTTPFVELGERTEHTRRERDPLAKTSAVLILIKEVRWMWIYRSRALPHSIEPLLVMVLSPQILYEKKCLVSAGNSVSANPKEVQDLVKTLNQATEGKPEKAYQDDSHFEHLYLQETISLLKAESERMSSQVSMDWAQRGLVEGGALTAKGEALARERTKQRMVQDDTVGLVAAGERSMKRSSGDKGIVGAHGSKSTPMQASKCNAAAHDKVMKMVDAGPLRHHRVRNYRYLDYLVGSEWVPADSLLGPPWDAKIEAYWSVTTRQKFRAVMEIPHPSCLHEPGPFGRYIKRAEIREGRWLFFDVREFERHDDPHEMLPEEGSDLGSEWEQALQRHWRRVEIAWERMLQAEEMDSLGLGWMSSMPKRDSLVSAVRSQDQGTKLDHQDQRQSG
ncbi:hypothetical protein KC343_g9539 [Hortaea werneckii]|nr:hypothetical protein KC352_g19318 [Hortaea werneckii]KAI7560486.1 hypothetical protein KC317_g9698 [Hortaea werneckii]KAI7609061.1 hypothetical protein KC346_g9337 [Hortaea werneckii]KAI7617145.1 hypothetical protein KC343_g9539 [Hortaea werneckii]KAI7658330.1 hypothetical protein KC319_g9267 [Hortaea werneckii]